MPWVGLYLQFEIAAATSASDSSPFALLPLQNVVSGAVSTVADGALTLSKVS